jgi:hypothetical protein
MLNQHFYRDPHSSSFGRLRSAGRCGGLLHLRRVVSVRGHEGDQTSRKNGAFLFWENHETRNAIIDLGYLKHNYPADGKRRNRLRT